MKTRRERLIALRDKVIKKLPLGNKTRVWAKGMKPMGWRQDAWFEDRAATFADGMSSYHPCNTTACVAGTAGLLPEFRAAGLCTIKSSGRVRVKKSARIPHPDWYYVNSSVSAFWGLSPDEGSRLFSGGLGDRNKDDRAHLLQVVNELIKASPKVAA